MSTNQVTKGKTLYGYSVVVDEAEQTTVVVGKLMVTATRDELSEGGRDWKYTVATLDPKGRVVKVSGSFLDAQDALHAGCTAAEKMAPPAKRRVNLEVGNLATEYIEADYMEREARDLQTTANRQATAPEYASTMTAKDRADAAQRAQYFSGLGYGCLLWAESVAEKLEAAGVTLHVRLCLRDLR